MQPNPEEIKEQSSNSEQPEAHEELERSNLHNRVTCPITGFIFKDPVQLIPDVTSRAWNNKIVTATIEQESYAEMIRSTNKRCPVTRVPITGVMRNLEIESLVAEYLNTHPQEKQRQYQLKNTSTQENQPTTTEQNDIETGASTIQTDGNFTVGERNHQNTNELQLAPITQDFPFRACLGKTIGAIAKFISINAFFTALSMLGALMLKSDVYEVGLAAAVGSATLTTIGALFHLWAHCAGSRLKKDETECLQLMGIVIASYGPVLISGIIGQLILHGESNPKLNVQLLASSFVGFFIAGLALNLSVYFAKILIKSCCNPPSSDNSVDNSSVSIPPHTYDLRSETSNTTHANPHRFRFFNYFSSVMPAEQAFELESVNLTR